jgi:exosortase
MMNGSILCENRRRFLLFIVCATFIVVASWPILKAVAQLSMLSDVYSYIPVIPVASLALIIADRKTGSAFLLIQDRIYGSSPCWSPEQVVSCFSCVRNHISGAMFLGVCLWIAVFASVFGPTHRACFPFFLLLLVPLPDRLLGGIVRFLHASSAVCTESILRITGVPVLRNGMVLPLSRLYLEVAPECSGIRSSIVVLVVSLILASLYLRVSWHRFLLVVAVVAAVILNNSLRIVPLALLAVYLAPA